MKLTNTIPNLNWNIAQARPMSVSDVSRSLQRRVSTTHRSYSQLTISIFYKIGTAVVYCRDHRQQCYLVLLRSNNISVYVVRCQVPGMQQVHIYVVLVIPRYAYIPINNVQRVTSRSLTAVNRSITKTKKAKDIHLV